jgi:peptidoglycan/xylan/chitin deacetylase (PgdA/CDA1 family)
MKPVMYHYVRPCAPGLPNFPYLSLHDFELQLDYFSKSQGFVSREDFTRWVAGGPVPQGVLLTFDDGLRDHEEFVLPVLRDRGLFGLFYVPSGPIMTNTLLDVHKVHLVVGRIGGGAVVQWLENEMPEILPAVSERDGAASRYAAQRSDNATKLVKHLFNWHLSAEERGNILDALLDHAFAGKPPRWEEFYLDEKAVRALTDAGMGLGPHSHTHSPLSRLSAKQETEEIEISCDFVESVGGTRMWGYCYPHGLPDSFSERSQRAVAEAGCPFAFAVAANDINERLAASARFALPRHNCNAFFYGAPSFGALSVATSPAQRPLGNPGPTG